MPLSLSTHCRRQITWFQWLLLYAVGSLSLMSSAARADVIQYNSVPLSANDVPQSGSLSIPLIKAAIDGRET